MRESLRNLAIRLHIRIFGDEPGPMTKNFIMNLSYVGVGFACAAVLGTLLQIYIGRVLGPADYGLFSFVRSLSLFMIIPLTMGGFAMVKYSAETEDRVKRKQIVSISLLLTLAVTLVFLPVFYVAGPYITPHLKISEKYFNWAILLAVGATVADMTRRFLQGLHKMKKIAVIELLSTMFRIAIVIIFFVMLSQKTVESAVTAFFIGFSMTALFVLPELREYVGSHFDGQTSRTILNYSTYALLANLSHTILYNVDRILIGRFLGMASLGIYQVYNFSTFGVATYLMVIFGTVLFPESSRSDKQAVWNKLKRGMRLSPLIYVFTLCTCFVFLILYGREYPLNLYYLLIFPLMPAIYSVYSTYDWYSISLGVKGVRNAFYCRSGVAVLTIALDVMLIPAIGIIGAAISLIVSYTLILPLLLVRSKRLATA